MKRIKPVNRRIRDLAVTEFLNPAQTEAAALADLAIAKAGAQHLISDLSDHRIPTHGAKPSKILLKVSSKTLLRGKHSLAYGMGVQPKKLHTRERLSRNLKMLLRLAGWSQNKLAEKTGVSQRTISGIINMEVSPSVDTAEALAEGFGLTGFNLISENLPNDLERCKSIRELVDNYLKSDEGSQDYLLHVAEREAKRGR